jgi:hypothetical protein
MDPPMDLTPILVAGFGRSGTTVLLNLLATDARVAFDRRYPNENRYLSYLAKFALLTARPGGSPQLSSDQLCDFDDGRLGSFPWPTDPLPGLEPPLAPPPAAWLAALWGAFAAAVRGRRPGATHYAEKAPAWLPAAVRDVLPCRTLHLVRDPRDVFLSARAFIAARRATGFGRAAGDTDLDHARTLAHAMLVYHENERADRDRADAVCVRYEDLILNRPAEVERLSRFLGLDLSPEEPPPAQELPQHRTTPDLAASIGRWRREPLPPGVRELLESQLRELLVDHGYDAAGTAPASALDFGDLVRHGPLHCSADGELVPTAGGLAVVRVTGGDFWVELPEAEVAAKAVREVWVCARGDTGDHCSLFWRRRSEPFAEGRAVHVPFHPGGHWQVLRFRVAGHPHWHGTVVQLRVDLFNGRVTPGGGAVRRLRLIP